MAFLEWSPLFSVGVERLDQQHRNLVALINEFCEAHETHASQTEVPAVLNRLIKYAQTHFRDEEALMEELGYEGTDGHRGVHVDLTEQIFEFQRQYECGDLGTSERLLEFLRRWLIGHILSEDMRYRDFFQSKGLK